MVAINLLNNEVSPGLLNFLTSSGKKDKETLRPIFPANKFKNLKFLEGESITVKSASHIDLPAYSFVATYDTETKGIPCKFWGVFILRTTNPRYVMFLYVDNEENYKIYLPFVKAMFDSLSIK